MPQPVFPEAGQGTGAWGTRRALARKEATYLFTLAMLEMKTVRGEMKEDSASLAFLSIYLFTSRTELGWSCVVDSVECL